MPQPMKAVYVVKEPTRNTAAYEGFALLNETESGTIKPLNTLPFALLNCRIIGSPKFKVANFVRKWVEK